jgi:hypothetical protein
MANKDNHIDSKDIISHTLSTTPSTITLGAFELCSILIPSTTTLVSATCTFQVSLDGVTFTPLHVATTAGAVALYTLTFGTLTNIAISLPVEIFCQYRAVKLIMANGAGDNGKVLHIGVRRYS